MNEKKIFPELSSTASLKRSKPSNFAKSNNQCYSSKQRSKKSKIISLPAMAEEFVLMNPPLPSFSDLFPSSQSTDISSSISHSTYPCHSSLISSICPSSSSPYIAAQGNLRLINRITAKSVQSDSLSGQDASNALEICSGDILSFLDSQNRVIVPHRVLLVFGQHQRTSSILEGENGVYPFPQFNISNTNHISIHAFYGAAVFRFRCIGYQNFIATSITPKNFYILVLDKDPSLAYRTLETIPLASRLPFVTFRIQEDELQFHGQTALHAAARAGHLQLVQLLLVSGSDINAVNHNNCSSIYLASFHGHHRVVEALLAAGAEKNSTTSYGATPIYIASFNGHHQVVAVLLAAGADSNIPTNDGATPIFVASFKGYHRVVEYLLVAGAEINSPNKYGATPISVASFSGHCRVVELLIVAGADVNLPANDGVTSIFVASFNGHHRVVELLLAAGADKNAPLKDGSTPIFAAAENGHYLIVERLLAAGADLNAPTNDGATPIFAASEGGHPKVVELLLAAGAALNAPNNYGATPLDIAAQRGKSQVVEILIAAGASQTVGWNWKTLFHTHA